LKSIFKKEKEKEMLSMENAHNSFTILNSSVKIEA